MISSLFHIILPICCHKILKIPIFRHNPPVNYLFAPPTGTVGLTSGSGTTWTVFCLGRYSRTAFLSREETVGYWNKNQTTAIMPRKITDFRNLCDDFFFDLRLAIVLPPAIRTIKSGLDLLS